MDYSQVESKEQKQKLIVNRVVLINTFLSFCLLIFEQITIITIFIIITITFQVCVKEEETAAMKGDRSAQD